MDAPEFGPGFKKKARRRTGPLGFADDRPVFFSFFAIAALSCGYTLFSVPPFLHLPHAQREARGGHLSGEGIRVSVVCLTVPRC